MNYKSLGLMVVIWMLYLEERCRAPYWMQEECYALNSMDYSELFIIGSQVTYSLRIVECFDDEKFELTRRFVAKC
uniref:Putative secreted protein n=1 Tax=Xenopsylla cheopis TaxID=163159 RepID=A0A6M2E1S8_XENCH